ncbi:Pro-apoptotic serine protease [Yarrowia sp. E02]|nr:Pro-apoptotic serine protease [Yarrowia sp. E02]
MSLIHQNDSSSVWLDTVSRTVKCIVSVYFRHHEAVEFDHPLKSEASGFVVDKEQGIIVTNRHVIGAGVFSGKIKFHNFEECKVEVLYCDPIHDFGFLKFNPKDIKHVTIGEISLRPDLARVGTEIRILGNDSGQQLSILSGFISRVQRNAPHYGDHTYNDFNTFYIQAAANAKGGSSGSPVINIDGHAVGLQAGGMTFSTTDYFLPLQRVKRALDIVRGNGLVTRGCLQTVWEHKAFNTCSHYGLPDDIEGRIRKKYPDNVGMLVAKHVVKDGNSDKKIQVGDILVSVDGEDIIDFSVLDNILDESVGKTHSIEVFRDTELLKFDVEVADLHALSCNEFVKFGGMTFHNMTYQLVRSTNEPIDGVIVACGGPTDVNCRSRLYKINGKAMSNLTELKEFFQNAEHGKSYAFEFRVIKTTNRENRSVRFDLHFYPDFVSAVKNGGTWTMDKLVTKGGKSTTLPTVIKGDKKEGKLIEAGEEKEGEADTDKKVDDKKEVEAAVTTESDKKDDSDTAEKKIPTILPASISDITSVSYAHILQSFVTVTVSRPINCDSAESVDNGLHSDEEYQKTGYVIDKDLGIILTTNVIFSYFSTVYITFFDQVRLPVSIKYIDLQQNYALLQYDPSMIVAPVTELKLSGTKKNNFVIGEKVHSYAPDPSKAICSRMENSILNTRFSTDAGEGCDTLLVERELEKYVGCGILTDPETDEVIAMAGSATTWRSRVRGVYEVHRVLETIRKGEPLPEKRFINVYFTKSTLLHARDNGLSEERVLECTSDQGGGSGGVYSTVFASSDTPFKSGDILLKIEGKNIKEDDFAAFSTLEEFEVLVLRDHKEETITVKTQPASELLTSRLFLWCDNVFQKPWIDVRQTRTSEWPSEMVVFPDSSQLSDLENYNVCFVTHVNSKRVRTMDELQKSLLDVPNGTYATIVTELETSGPQTSSIYCNYETNPLIEYVRNGRHWTRTEYGVQETRVIDWDEWTPSSEKKEEK